MIQAARNANSRSLLRELEFMTLLIGDDKIRHYFLGKLNEVYNKRNGLIDDNAPKSISNMELKKQLLHYLRSQSQDSIVETANIWARALPYDEKAINNLLLTLQNQLMKQGIEGVLEVHLQDREINSPHIQFVGNNADRAEQIIAAILVKMKYEIDMENALGKKHFTPYYQINEKASYPKHTDLKNTIEYYKNLTSVERNIEAFKLDVEKIDNVISSFKRRIQEFTKLKETPKTTSSFEERLQEMIFETQSRRMRRFRHRHRRRR